MNKNYFNEHLMYQNHFTQDTFFREEVPEDILIEYKRQQEEKMKFQELTDILMIQSKDNQTIYDMLDESEKVIKNEDRDRLSKTTVVSIDSKDRDKSVYPKPNKYTIELKNKFTNIKKISLVSTEFPTTEQVIRSLPIERKNNLIKWRVKVNGTELPTVYMAAISPGNYIPSSFRSAIELQMNRVQPDVDLLNLFGVDFKFNFTCNIDLITDIVSIQSLKTVNLSNPFSIFVSSREVIVNHNNHGYSSGDTIYITGSSRFGGLSQDVINTPHIISVINSNSYKFVVDTSASITDENKGGNSVQIGTGLDFQLLFSEDTTIYQGLGFEKENTEFKSIQTNTKKSTEYTIISSSFNNGEIIFITEDIHPFTDGEVIYIENHDTSNVNINTILNRNDGHMIKRVIRDLDPPPLCSCRSNKFVIDGTLIGTNFTGIGGITFERVLNKPVILSGENYLFLCIKNLGNLITSTIVEDVFAKILLTGSPGSILFNTYVSSAKSYDDSPLNELDKLEISIKTSNNDFYEFNDVDHSFSLEIIELLDKPNNVGISSRTGIIDKTNSVNL